MNMSSEDMHVEYSIAMATLQLANKIMKNGLPDICKLAVMVFMIQNSPTIFHRYEG